MSDLSGKIQTVLGCIDPATVGRTYTHEHLCLDFMVSYYPASAENKAKETMPITLENLGWIRQNPYSHIQNLHMNEEADRQAVIEEMKFFKQNGGSTIVDNTTKGIERDVKYLKQVATETGINVIAGSGYYEGCCHPAGTSTKSVEELSQEMIHDITVGCDGTDIKCGVIGEIASVWPMEAIEKKMLLATAEAQKVLGCPVIIHPAKALDSPFEIVRILQEAGGDIGKTVMSHLDRTIFDVEKLFDFAALGAYCEYDLFGIEVSYYQRNPNVDMMSDAQRIQMIKKLFDEGYGDKVVIGHDVHTKHRLTKYGGHGYSHILNNVVPKMLHRGFSQEDVDKILIENPRRWLTFK